MEVRYTGTVLTQPTYFSSRHSHRTHEQFDVRADDGSTFRVIDNVSIAPRVPAHPGDRVSVQGELIHARGKQAMVHWTHHDPGRRHVDGFVELNGRLYA